MRRLIAFLLLAASLESSYAQAPSLPNASLLDARITERNQAVAVRVADPFARVDLERAMLKLLNERSLFDWNHETTVIDIATDVSTRVPLQIDHRALEELGLTADALVFPNRRSADKKTAPRRLPTEDPFAQTATRNSGTVLASKPTKPTKPPMHWWQREQSNSSTGSLNNAAVLFHGLANLDLVLATQSGNWLITTEEAAEESLSTRLYDVTPLAHIRPPTRRPATHLNYHELCPPHLSPDELVDVVQMTVDPDAWELLGGTSTCRPVLIGDRTWLVTSAPVMVHWKVHALLCQLNGSR